MLFWILFVIGRIALAQEIVLVDSVIEIVDHEKPILELEAKDSLLFSSSDWWEKLPIFRDISAFESHTHEKVFRETQLLWKFFVDQGYRDVEISTSVLPYQGKGLRRGPRDKDCVLVYYTVSLGQLWTVEQILILGLKEGQSLNVNLELDNAVVFSRKLQEKAEAAILEELRENGYANVDVSWQSRVTGDHQLSLEAIVSLNEQFEFGSIAFLTWDGRVYKPFFDEYQWMGERYDPRRIRALDNKLDSLSLYGKVETEEVIQAEDKEVDVLVRLEPIEDWDLEPIVGVASEATTWAVDLGGRWTFKAKEYSLFGRHEVGYRTYPQLEEFDFSHQGLTTWQELEISHPIASFLTGEWFVEGQGIVEAQIGYQDILLRTALGLRWLPTLHWRLDTGLAWQHHSYLPMIGKEQMFQKWFGDDGLVEQVIQPEISFNLAYLNSEYTWMELKLTPIALCNDAFLSSYYFRSEARIPFGRWTLRPRLQQGAVAWHGDRDNSLHNRFFLGGSSTIRGWAYRRVRIPDDESEVFDISRGAERMGMASLELQYEFLSTFSVLSFVDAGRIWDAPPSGEGEFRNLPKFLPSVGIGLLFPSPVGDIILAPAWQLLDADVAHAPTRMTTHLYLSRGIGE